MPVIAEEKDLYLEQQARLEKQLADRKGSVLKGLRQTACDRFAQLTFPTSRNEDWKFTSVAPILEVPFELASPANLSRSLRERITAEMLPACINLVFINGYFSPELSDQEHLPSGVIAGNLATLAERHPDMIQPYLARLADYEDHIFTALNSAFLHDGAFIGIPRGLVLAEPVQVLFVSLPGGKPGGSHPRTLVTAGINSQATIIEKFLPAGDSDDVYFTNAVTEIALEENAVVDHYRLQMESMGAFHLSNTQVRLARSSNFSSHALIRGGRLARAETRVLFNGEGSEATVNGLYLGNDSQHLDNFTVIDHARPHCTSHELYKGILDGKAHGVFNGKIFVRQDAQKTDAKQTNQVLLLSEDAVINTKPQLEIFADDVKCTHGATVGQLDSEALFYLRARGIGLEEARALLTFAFANDIIGRIKVEAIREQLERLLTVRPLTRGPMVQGVS